MANENNEDGGEATEHSQTDISEVVIQDNQLKDHNQDLQVATTLKDDTQQEPPVNLDQEPSVSESQDLSKVIVSD